MRRSKPVPHELLEQIQLFRVLRMFPKAHPAIPWIHSSLNGVRLPPKLASEQYMAGMTKGVWDIFVPAHEAVTKGLRFPALGLYIEMKAGRNKTTPEQDDFRTWAESQGYQCAVCYNWIEAARAIADYLDIKASENNVFAEQFLNVLRQAEDVPSASLPEGKTRQ